jgi:predicted methyltransferase
MRRFLLVMAASIGFAASPVTADAATPDDVENCEACEAVMDLALANPRREADRARDPWRNPAETIAFFRIRPGMTVVDYMPANGWWTRILAPYLGEDGRYIGLNPDLGPQIGRRPEQVPGDLGAEFVRRAAGWTGMSAGRIAAYDSDGVPPALVGTVDRVVLMRQLHNLHRFGWLANELATIRRLLKPDGLLGVEEHRARPDAPPAYADGGRGYMRERDVIALVEAAGFELAGRSEINANPADTADHPTGVWSLAPTFAEGERDRTRYAAIGESDRMTLLFRKRA